MAIRSRKPTSPGRRFQTVSDFAEVTKKKPEKSLVGPKPKSGGRNAHGRKTSRHRGGGHKQQYRQIDFKRIKDGVTAKVAAIEYDPNRTCRIALLHYADGTKAYILAPVVSEKSYALMELGVYTFKVHPSASKPEIRDAVEAIWGVEVSKVNTLNRKGKRRRTRGTNRIGSTPDTKRAIVTLAAGEIPLFEN